jgi:hypothetical protein
MALNPLLQLNIRFEFGPFGIFEMLQFDTSEFNTDISMGSFINEMKELLFFESSQSFSEKDRFGNYIINKISGEDFAPIQTHELIAKLNFEDEELEYFISMKEVHHLMAHNVRRHTGEFEFFYELSISPDKQEKMAPTSKWKDFTSFIGIDKKRKIAHIISSGSRCSIAH